LLGVGIQIYAVGDGVLLESKNKDLKKLIQAIEKEKDQNSVYKKAIVKLNNELESATKDLSNKETEISLLRVENTEIKQKASENLKNLSKIFA
jgi:chromosome segregation ATPase